MWQQSIVVLLVLASGLWLAWTLVLPTRLKRILSRGQAHTAGGCHGCALGEAGCAPGTRKGAAAHARRAAGPPTRARAGAGGHH